ncbi:hypothetical protein Ancab_026683 [Ancistrocladus abbreviatus]
MIHLSRQLVSVKAPTNTPRQTLNGANCGVIISLAVDDERPRYTKGSRSQLLGFLSFLPFLSSRLLASLRRNAGIIWIGRHARFIRAKRVKRGISFLVGMKRAMLGSGGVSDGYEIGSKRQRMMESNPYFAVGSSAGGYRSYVFESSFQPSGFPVVRLRGLPFDCTDIDVFKFFAGLDIVDVLLVNRNGRFSGEAFVVFASPVQADLALQRDRQSIGRRYVEIFRCKKQDYYYAVAEEASYEGFCDNGSPLPGRSRRSIDKDQLEYTEILKLRGLPFSATKSDIVEYFGEFKPAEDKVHIACRADGKATGEAYVEFSSAEEAKKAMCKDNMTIGSRYIELFPSTQQEARRAESRAGN